MWGRGSRGGYGDSPMASMASHGDAKGAEVTNAKTVVALAHGGGGRLWSASWDATVRGWQPQPEGGSGVVAECLLGPSEGRGHPEMKTEKEERPLPPCSDLATTWP